MLVSKESTEGQAMGLLADSVIVADNIATVAGSSIDRALGKCPVMRQVDRAPELVLSLGGAGDFGG